MKRPFLIGIGGTCSDSGKTTIAVLLLKHLLPAGNRQQTFQKGGQYSVNQSVSVGYTHDCAPGKWGAVKYTKTELFTSLIDDRDVLSEKDKDTGRFIKAGAEGVVWVKAPSESLAEVLPLALERLSGLEGLVIEGNSAIEFLKPDIVIFIFGNDKRNWKTGIENLAGMADIIIYEDESCLPEFVKAKRLFLGDVHGIKEVQEFFEFISGLIYERKTERRNNEKSC